MAVTDSIMNTGGIFNIASLLIGIGIFYYIARAVYNVYFHPLSSFPGPRLAAASQLPYIYHVGRGNSVPWHQDLHRIYGEVVRTRPNEISFITETAWKDIYMHSQGRRQFQKGFFTTDVNNTDSLLSADDATHSRQRKLLAHAFSDKALREQEQLLQSYINLLISKLREESDAGNGVVDLVEWYNYTTFDIIADLSFGESFHNLANKAEHAWIKSVFPALKAALFLDLAAGFPPLSWFINTILPGWLRAQRAKSLRFVQEKLSARLSKESERPDFVSYVLRYNDERGINRDEMDSNFDLFTIAGSETTATLLAGCTYHLLRNPGVLQRLNDEVRTGFSSAADITIAAANKLPYLLAVLEESLRMHPPVPAGASRIVPPGGSTISGCWVPGGTLVTIPQFAAYHSPNNFAKPTSFIPSRWLEKHEPIFDNDRKAIFQPFSAGPRNCIGKNLAYAEMKLILAKMVWHFDMELVTTEGNWADQKVYLVFQRTQLLVKLTPRVQ